MVRLATRKAQEEGKRYVIIMIESKRMNCFIIAALTADGFIGRDAQQTSTHWTSSEDYQWFTQKSKEAGVLVMGRKTYETIGKPLTERVNIIYSRQTSGQNLVENQEQLLEGQVYYTQLSPEQLLQQLAGMGFEQVAVGGGSSIYTLFMEAGVVDELFLTLEPIIFGQGVSLFSQSLEVSLELVAQKKLSTQTQLFHYRVKTEEF